MHEISPTAYSILLRAPAARCGWARPASCCTVLLVSSQLEAPTTAACLLQLSRVAVAVAECRISSGRRPAWPSSAPVISSHRWWLARITTVGQRLLGCCCCAAKKHVVGRPLVHSPSAQLSRPVDSGPRYCSGTERGRWRSSQPHRRGHYHDDCIDSRIAPAARLAPLRQVQRGLPGFARHRGTLHFRVRTDNAAAGGAACPAPSQAPYHMPPAGQLTDIVETAARDPASPSNVSDRR